MITKEELREQLLQQERDLSFDSFTNEDALMIGTGLAEHLRYSDRPCAIRIFLEDINVFQYTMKGKEESHYGWALKKYNLVRKTGHSSMLAKVRLRCFHELEDLFEDKETYAFGAGGFPVYVNGEMKGAICISGLAEPFDHVAIVETLEELYDRSTAVLPVEILEGKLPA